MNNLIYPPTGAFRPGNGFAALQAPNHSHSLRHHASASNDALRGFGPINPPITEPSANSAFPQELYSSSATLPLVPPPASDSSSPPFALPPRSAAGSEYDYPMNGLNGLVGSPPQPMINHRPSTNTFTLPPQQPSVAAVGSFAQPVLPPNLLQTVSKPPAQASLVPSVLSQHPPNGLQTQNPTPMYTAVPTSYATPAPTAQLVQILSSLPPQQKNAVIGRLQEMAQGINTQSPLQPAPGSTGQLQVPPQPPMLSTQPQAQPGAQQEEISTIFVVGFPDDMTEREFQNMFTFCHGYEAATLKVPPKDIPVPAPSNPAVAAAASALAGASDPYNLVTVNSGGVVVDQGNNTTATTSSTWATGLEDPYTRHALAAAAASSNTSTSELAQQLALAQTTQPRKQIIGFAKFKTKEDALMARDVLHGRRVDIEKGALLKAEMAKKNLHTKRGVGPMQVSLPSGANTNGPPQPGPPVGTESPTPIPGAGLRPPNGIPQDGDRSMSSSFASLATAVTSTSDGSHGKTTDSPTFRLQRLNEIQPFVPSGGPHLMAGPVTTVNEPSTFYSTPPQPAFHRNGIQNLHHQPSLPSLAEGRTTEGFHALPNKPISDIVKANALPPTNLPPPSNAGSIAGSMRAASSRGGDSPPGPESDAGYVSDALSTSHMSERSRAESVGRYGRYTPPPSDEPQLHLPPHLLQDDVLGTPQQTDYASKLIEEADFAATVEWHTSIRPVRKMTGSSAMAFSPPANDVTGFIGSSASSAAGSVSSGGADSVSTSTTSGGNANTSNIFPAPHHELGRQRGQTMPSMRSVMNGNGHLSGGEQSRSSAEHPRRGGNAADQNPPINTLYVGNLPTSLTTPQSAKTLEDALVQLFSRAPGYSKLCFRQKNNGPMCFVEFDDVSSASKALGELYGNTLNGLVKGGGIRLSYSKNPLGVRTNVPSNPNKVTSPVQSPTTHAPYQFGNIPPGMQEQRSAMPLDMPRTGRMRAETMERIHMGPASPPGRFMATSPPNGLMSAFGPIGGFGRGPMNVPPQGPQSYGMAPSPPATSPMAASAYQPSASFQPFAPLDLTPQPPPPGNDPAAGI